MSTHYLQSFVNKTRQYKKSLFCIAASCCYLLAGQPQEADAGTVHKTNVSPEQAKRMIAELERKMSLCSSESMLDRLRSKREALETTLFSPKNAALLLAGTDSCPGTNIPAGTSFSDTGTTIGANNTVASIQAGCSDYTTVNGPDVVYKFVLPALGSRIATCSINLSATGGGGDDLSVYTLRQAGGGCPNGTGNAVTNCQNGSDVIFSGSATNETITDAEMDAMPAGIYYLFVDSFYNVGDPDADGPYSLNLTCTTLAPTAAFAGVGGRVTTADGRAIGGARVSVVLPSGESRFAISNPFGFYRFDDVEVGQSYVFQVSSKNNQFSNASQLITVNGELEDVNFIADAPLTKGGR